MASKSKGVRYERELAHMFWLKNWAVCRVAGSGSMPIPVPDILAGNGKRHLAIECKSLRKSIKYLSKGEVKQLMVFCRKFGAEAWIGVRFDDVGWFFLRIKDLKKTNKGYAIPINLAKKKGLSFKELIGEYRQKRLG